MEIDVTEFLLFLPNTEVMTSFLKDTSHSYTHITGIAHADQEKSQMRDESQKFSGWF